MRRYGSNHAVPDRSRSKRIFTRSLLLRTAISVGVISGGVTFGLASAASAATPAAPSISPTSLNFGNQALGITSLAQTVTVTNTDPSVPLVMYGYCGSGCGNNPNISGGNSGNYSITNDGCNDGTSLNPGQDCTFQVTFDPSTASSEDSTVHIDDNVTGSPQQVPQVNSSVARNWRRRVWSGGGRLLFPCGLALTAHSCPGHAYPRVPSPSTRSRDRLSRRSQSDQ